MYPKKNIFKRCVSIAAWFIPVVMVSLQSAAQHHSADSAQDNHRHAHAMKGSHRISFGIGHTSVSEGNEQGNTSWLPLASWSLNYDYWITEKWGIGLQNDLILETFFIEKHGQEEIERKNPFSMVPVALYKLSDRWTLIAGAGVEFSRVKNLGMTRLGIEYGIPMPKHWEVGIAAVWDGKWNYYNSWGVAFTVSKLFKKQKSVK